MTKSTVQLLDFLDGKVDVRKKVLSYDIECYAGAVHEARRAVQEAEEKAKEAQKAYIERVMKLTGLSGLELSNDACEVRHSLGCMFVPGKKPAKCVLCGHHRD